MRAHRGVTESTLGLYRYELLDLVNTLGKRPDLYKAKALRTYVIKLAEQRGRNKAKMTATATRMFLRFLVATGKCVETLQSAIPNVAQWRLSSLPKHLQADKIETLIETCSPSTQIGCRDRAVMLLLARLGLRAGEVSSLRFQDVDWSVGRLRLTGKGRRESWLPLPQDAGDAIIDYLSKKRPKIKSEYIFITARAPFVPIRRNVVSQTVARAIRASGIDAPSHGAHLIRHSLATSLLNQGVQMQNIGTLLRHKSIETTALYAKVDIRLLDTVTMPWPEVTPC